MSRRREKRTSVAMPVLMDRGAEGADFLPTNAVTLDVTSRGARVQLQSDWAVGEVIWVERQSKRAQFRVVWVGDQGSAKQQQIGIECVEPEFDWGIPLLIEDDIVPEPLPTLLPPSSVKIPHLKR